jgi:hypothetical protein
MEKASPVEIPIGLSDIILFSALVAPLGLNITDGWKLLVVVAGGVFEVQPLDCVKLPTVPIVVIWFVHVPLLSVSGVNHATGVFVVPIVPGNVCAFTSQLAEKNTVAIIANVVILFIVLII